MQAIHTLATIAIVMLGLIATPDVPGQADESNRSHEGPPKVPSLGEQDLQVINVALSELVRVERFTPMHASPGYKQIFLDRSAAGTLNRGEIGRHFGAPSRLLPDVIRADLVRRNARGRMTLSNLKPTASSVTIEDMSIWDGKRLHHANEGARGWMRIYAPGYSDDGRTAVLMFRCGNGFHSQVALIGLVKKHGAWAASWMQSTHYLRERNRWGSPRCDDIPFQPFTDHEEGLVGSATPECT